MKYSMVIQWSNEDHVYVVSLPEWEAAGRIGHVHGKTYAEAVQQGEELIENLVEWAKQDGSPIPEPQIFSVA